jgi:hypothetical protein
MLVDAGAVNLVGSSAAEAWWPSMKTEKPLLLSDMERDSPGNHSTCGIAINRCRPCSKKGPAV